MNCAMIEWGGSIRGWGLKGEVISWVEATNQGSGDGEAEA